MTTEQRDELRRLHAAATPGPWECGKLTTGEYELYAGEDLDICGELFGDDSDPQCWPVTANAHLIVTLRNQLPALLDALDAAEKKVKLLHDATIILRNGMGSHDHWDTSQCHGIGCSQCIMQRDARKAADKLIAEAAAKPHAPLYKCPACGHVDHDYSFDGTGHSEQGTAEDREGWSYWLLQCSKCGEINQMQEVREED